MLLPVILAYVIVLAGVLLATRIANGLAGFLVFYPLTIASAAGLNAVVFGYAAEVNGGDVKDTFVASAAIGLGVSFMFFPLNFWLKRRKAAKNRQRTPV